MCLKKNSKQSLHLEIKMLKRKRQEGRMLVFTAQAAVNREDAQEH